MRKVKFSLVCLIFSVFVFGSCKKNKCSECHYDSPVGEVQLGEKCGDELEAIEANGYTDGTTVYEVHCHEH